MDVSRIFYAARQNKDKLLWLIAAVTFAGICLRSFTLMATMPAYDVKLPESPSLSDDVTPGAVSLNLSLFNEKNAWTEFSTHEMRTDDKRLRDAPPSQLPLKIFGVLFHNRHEKSLAIISAGGAQFTAGEGEFLANSDIRVARIFNDRVIIINRGLYEALHLESDGRG